jgi:hypothetical protein
MSLDQDKGLVSKLRSYKWQKQAVETVIAKCHSPLAANAPTSFPHAHDVLQFPWTQNTSVFPRACSLHYSPLLMPLFLLQQILLHVLHMLMMRFSCYLWTQQPSVFPQSTAPQCILWRHFCIYLYFFLWFLLQIFDIPPLATCSFRAWFQFQNQQLNAWQFHNPKTTATTLTTTRQMVAYCKRWLRSETESLTQIP